MLTAREEPSFPEQTVGGFMIENPSNSNEIIIGTEDSKSLYIYCTKTSKFHKNVNDFNTISKEIEQKIGSNISDAAEDWTLMSAKTMITTHKDAIIMVGVWEVDKVIIPFYCVFNTKSKNFDKIIYHHTTIMEMILFEQMDTRKPFWFQESQFNMYKNYLIVTHNKLLFIMLNMYRIHV